MGKLYDELVERVSEQYGPPFYDLKPIHIRYPRYEKIEENEEVLIFEVVRHPSADGVPLSGGPGAFMYFERTRYHYRGGEDMTSDVIGEPSLKIDEEAFVIREFVKLGGVFPLGDSVDETRKKLNSLPYDTQKELYEHKGMDFDIFLDKLAQKLHQ